MDEPCFKSVIKLSVFVERMSHECISNTPCVAIEEILGGRWFHFGETPKMSAYLLAFVIGKFEFVEFTTKSGINVRGYVPVGKTESAKQLTQIGAEALDLYEDFF